MNPNHLKILRQGVDEWRAWRLKKFFVKPDLSGANLIMENLSGANLIDANLSGANLVDANLSRADLIEADLSGTKLISANIMGADIRGANLSGADLRRANLLWANLNGADIRGANLSDADLMAANLNEADIRGADLTSCRICGISAWRLMLDDQTKQQSLIITLEDEPEITVDNIEVAQFIYLLLHNENIREVIGTIGKKAVLILGCFSITERKAVLDALRDALRKHDLLPIVFDFPSAPNLDVTETVKVLAGLARFVIADITDATEVRAELHNIVPDFTKLPVQPILLRGKDEFVSLPGHLKSPWVLPTFEYDSQEQLIARLDEVIRPAQAKLLELQGA